MSNGDCVIRALTKALEMEWKAVFNELVPYAIEMQAMPNNKVCYEKYIADKWLVWYGCKAKKGCKRQTVSTFTKSHKSGVYILRVAHHLVTVVDGNYYDTWDCGDKAVYGYWTKE